MPKSKILQDDVIDSVSSDPFFMTMPCGCRYTTKDATGIVVYFGPKSITESLFFFSNEGINHRICIDESYARKFKEIIEEQGVDTALKIASSW
jgi:hypothetical protein